MNTYINTVIHPILGQKYMLMYKKTIFLNFFPPRCTFFLLCNAASTVLFETKIISKNPTHCQQCNHTITISGDRGRAHPVTCHQSIGGIPLSPIESTSS